MKSVLVTGGSGFVASNLVDKLVDLDYFVINLDKLDYCSFNNTEDIKGKYKFINGNICNKEFVLFILKEYDVKVIYHLAAQTHVDNSFYDSTQFTMDNVVGTHNLLECARIYDKLEKFVHMSTDEVYGEVLEGDSECTENSVLKPTNPYSATKAGAELLVSSYYTSYKLPIVVVRCNNIYGPRQYPEKVIPSFICSLLNGGKCNMHGTGENERHFIYVDDVVDALLCVYEKGSLNNIYNISNEDCYKIMDLSKKLILDLTGDTDYEKHIDHVDDRNFNDYRYLINSHKLEKLGWKPKVKFEEGLLKTIEYYRGNDKYKEYGFK